MLLISAAGCGKSSTGGSGATDSTGSNSAADVETVNEPQLAAKADALSAEIDEISKNNKATGVSVVAFENGEITYTHHYGYANKAKKTAPDDETMYRVASLSKLVSAITVMKAVDEGKVDLDKDVGDMLGYTVRNPKYPDTPITLRMLLSHSSSITDTGKFDAGDYTSNKALLKSSLPYLKYAPGEGYEYSNFGIQTAGNAVEVAINETFHDYAEKQIFEPMGITASYLASTLKDSSHIAVIYNSKGGVSRSVKAQLGPKRTRALGELRGVVQSSLTITPVDYAKLLIMLINDGQYEDKQIISAESAQEILKTQYEDEKVNYCLCVRKSTALAEDKTIYCHSGEAFGILSAFAFDKDSKNGVVVVTNGAKQVFDDESGLSKGCDAIVKAVFEAMKPGTYGETSNEGTEEESSEDEPQEESLEEKNE